MTASSIHPHNYIWFKAPVSVKYSFAGVVGFISSFFNINFSIQFGTINTMSSAYATALTTPSMS